MAGGIETASLVVTRLRAAGLAVTTGIGGHGVVAVLRGRTVAYQADVDAVPPSGQFGGGTEPLHLCGAVGALPTTSATAGTAPGSPVPTTMPAEIHALHCGPFPVGHFAVMPGFGMSGQDRGPITLTGPGAPSRAADIAGTGTVALSADPAAVESLWKDLQAPNGRLSSFAFMGAQAVNADAGPSPVTPKSAPPSPGWQIPTAPQRWPSRPLRSRQWSSRTAIPTRNCRRRPGGHPARRGPVQRRGLRSLPRPYPPCPHSRPTSEQ